MLNAFHSNWTVPFFKFNREKEFYIEDYEILSTMLSALMWKKYNGDIKMVTDSIGAEYYKKLGIESIWNLGISTSLDDINKNDIDGKIFWAAGKLFALKNEKLPNIMMDTDFIIWHSIEERIKDAELCVIHKENIEAVIYPDKSKFSMSKEYIFNAAWDWGVKPCNTAFAYIKNNNFRDYYVDEAIKFMNGLEESNDTLINMVFAEQRLFSICAKMMNLQIKELATLKELFEESQNYYTHIWGYKNTLRNSIEHRRNFCKKSIKRIIKEFPEYEDMIANMQELKYYYKELSFE